MYSNSTCISNRDTLLNRKLYPLHDEVIMIIAQNSNDLTLFTLIFDFGVWFVDSMIYNIWIGLGDHVFPLGRKRTFNFLASW